MKQEKSHRLSPTNAEMILEDQLKLNKLDSSITDTAILYDNQGTRLTLRVVEGCLQGLYMPKNLADGVVSKNLRTDDELFDFIKEIKAML